MKTRQQLLQYYKESVGSEFELVQSDGIIRLTLESVNEFTQGDDHLPMGFSLLFKGAADIPRVLDQIYTVQREAEEIGQLYVSALQPDESGTYYEIIYN